MTDHTERGNSQQVVATKSKDFSQVLEGVKEFLESSGRMSGVPCHLVSALTCGFTATILASPIDVIKTRFINSPEVLPCTGNAAGSRYTQARSYCSIKGGRDQKYVEVTKKIYGCTAEFFEKKL